MKACRAQEAFVGSGSRFRIGVALGGNLVTSSMESVGISPVRAVEDIRDGHRVSPILTPSTVSSRQVRWHGIAFEAFPDVPASNIPHTHFPHHFILFFTPHPIIPLPTSHRSSRATLH